MYKVRALILFLLVLLLFAMQGCATQATEPPKNESMFLAHVRTTMNEIIETTKVAACETVSNDCPYLPEYEWQDQHFRESHADINSDFNPFANLVTTRMDE